MPVRTPTPHEILGRLVARNQHPASTFGLLLNVPPVLRRLTTRPDLAALVEETPALLYPLWLLDERKEEDLFDRLFPEGISGEDAMRRAINAAAHVSQEPLWTTWTEWVSEMPHPQEPTNGAVAALSEGYVAWLRTARFNQITIRNAATGYSVCAKVLQAQKALTPEQVAVAEKEGTWDQFYRSVGVPHFQTKPVEARVEVREDLPF